MSMVTDLFARVRSFLFGGRADRATRDEFAFHLAMETEKLVARGLSPEEARRQAVLAFGGVEAAREETRDARGVRWLEETARDLRFGWRQLLRTPGFTLVTILTLGLGIGATTAIFSVINGVVIQRLPFADAERLVVVWEQDRNSGTTREPSAWPDLVDLRARTTTLSEVAALFGVGMTYAPADGDPVTVSALGVTHTFFPLVGVAPILGRGLTAEEDLPGGPRVALVGHGFWLDAFGGDSGIVGRTLQLNDLPYTVLGVLPPRADFGLDQVHARAAYHATYRAEGEVDLWIPLQASEAAFSRNTHPFLAVGRLAPGSTLDVARNETQRLGAVLEQTYPESNAARGMDLEPLGDVVFGPVRPVLLLLTVAVVLVLMVAVVNVANLLLARGMGRMREVAVRTALGAGSLRLGRQFLAETMLLTLLGALVGVAMAQGGLDLLLALAPSDIPRIGEVRLDGRALLVSLGIAVGTGVVFGMVPLRQARRVDVMEMVRGSGPATTGDRGHGRARQALVVVELALSVTLVVSAALLIRSFQAVLNVNPGFAASGILKAEFTLPATRYPRDFSRYPRWAEVHRLNEDLLRRLGQIPGVTSAALSSVHPLDPGFTNSFSVVGREDEAGDWPEISTRAVSPTYFATMQVPLVAGRGFGETDATDGQPVALINQAAVDRFFQDQDPLGREIRWWGTNRLIVGVVGNERIHGLTEDTPAAAYAPLPQAPATTGVVLLRTRGDPTSLAAPVRRAITDADPALAVFGLEPFEVTVMGTVSERRFTMMVLAVFAFVTLALGLIGVHGVLSYTTAQRTHEIGIRAAMGASRASLLGLIMRNGLLLAGLGVLLGLTGAALGSRLLVGLLYGVQPIHPLIYLVVTIAVLAAVAVAIGMPAWRAARVSAMEALRIE